MDIAAARPVDAGYVSTASVNRAAPASVTSRSSLS